MMGHSKIRSSGFSLLEMLVVVFIVGMVTGVVIPVMTRSMTSVRLKTASRDVMNLLRIARETAIREQAINKIRVDFVNQTILLTDEFGKTKNQYRLPKEIEVEGIRIEGKEAERDKVVNVLYYPEGEATGAELILRSSDGKNRVILRTDSVTGTVRIVSADKEEGR